MRSITGKAAIAISTCGLLAAATAAAVTTVAPPAFADTASSTLASIKAKAATAISIRESALQSAIPAFTANPYVTAADRSAILTTLNTDASGLNALAPVIQTDTTAAKARSDYQSIFTQYRVFALALPQSRFAASADDLTGTVIPRLTDAQGRLESLLAGPDSGKDTSPVQAAMSDLSSRISGITTATAGLATTVLAYTPAQWDASHTILVQPKANLVTARADARAAGRDIATVIEALK